MNTPDGYQQAAKKAAERWKRHQSDELKEQIIATWRMTKEFWKEKKDMDKRQFGSYWRDAFTELPKWDFDFMTDTEEGF